MSIHILSPGLLTTVQDKGRTGFQRQGVIVSGPMDAFALRAANTLVGNGDDAAVLEMTLKGPEIIFESDTLISICGGDLTPRVAGEAVPLWRPVFLRAGTVLKFGTSRTGVRAYLAAAGGIDVPLVMQSRSTYLRAGIGGHEGRALMEGDRLPCGPRSALAESFMKRAQAAGATKPFHAAEWFIGGSSLPGYASNPVIRVMRGRDFDCFAEKSQEAFFTRPFQVTPQSDRMGYRLKGEPLVLKNRYEPVSEAVSFGTVQVPSEGQPIVLMADRQTIGGYPKIAQVITADLPVLAQTRPGEHVRFLEVTLQEAEELYIQQELEFEQLALAIGLYLKEGR